MARTRASARAAVALLVPPIMWAGWWVLLITTVPAAALGCTGLVMSTPKAPRDTTGNPIP